MRFSILGGRRREASQTSQTRAESLAAQPAAASALCLEVGSVATRATLVDAVDGQHRFVASGIAQTTLAGTAGDVVPGLRDAVAEVERVAHRRLADNAGVVSPERHDGSGVDAVVLTSGQPLRLALLSLETGLPLAEARATIRGSGVLMVDSLDPTELTRPGVSVEERLRAMLEKRPQVILVVARAAVDEGVRLGPVCHALAEALNRRAASRPAVLFVGAPLLAGQFETLLDGEVTVRTIDPTAVSLRSAVPRDLRELWRAHLVRESRGYDAATAWANCPIIPTAEAFATALRFLARRRACWVCGVDVGAATSCLIRATAERAVVHLAEIGVTREIGWALADDVFRQLLPGVEPDSLRDALWNRSLRPWALPETPEEQSLSRALTREAIRAARGATTFDACRWEREIGLVVARGGELGLTSQPAESAWAIAEGLGAVGVLELVVDRHGMLPGLGALADVAPQSAAEALLADGLTHLATLALGEGNIHHGGSACRATLRCLDGRTQQTDVLVGQVVALSLAPAEVGDLTLAPAEGVDFGWGVGQTVNLRVRGGAAGLLVGARIASGPPARQRKSFAALMRRRG